MLPRQFYLPLFTTLLLTTIMLPEKKKIKIFLAGDSTMSIKETKAYPETGWECHSFISGTHQVTIVQQGEEWTQYQNFLSEGLWKSIIDEVKPDDYVFISLATMTKRKKKENDTPLPRTFRMNSDKVCKKTREKGPPNPSLTPVSHVRKLDFNRHCTWKHKEYSAYVKSGCQSNSESTWIQKPGKCTNSLERMIPNYCSSSWNPESIPITGRQRKIIPISMNWVQTDCTADIERNKTLVPELAERIIVRLK